MDSEGEYALLEQYGPNDIFGEVFAMPYGDLGYAVEADSDCRVMFIPFDCIYGRCPRACQHHSQLTRNLFELSARKDVYKRQGVAQALEDAVEEGSAHGVLLAEGLGTADDDAVDNDEGDEHAQSIGQGGYVSLQQQVHDGDEAGNDNHEDGQAYLIGYDLTDGGYNHVAAGQYYPHRQAHAHAVEEGGGDGHGGAHLSLIHI